MNLPKREEFSLRSVFALPNASKMGLDSSTRCSTDAAAALAAAEPGDCSAAPPWLWLCPCPAVATHVRNAARPAHGGQVLHHHFGGLRLARTALAGNEQALVHKWAASGATLHPAARHPGTRGFDHGSVRRVRHGVNVRRQRVCVHALRPQQANGIVCL
jgi:hypothetical protein